MCKNEWILALRKLKPKRAALKFALINKHSYFGKKLIIIERVDFLLWQIVGLFNMRR
jgi:hypothetical protein